MAPAAAACQAAPAAVATALLRAGTGAPAAVADPSPAAAATAAKTVPLHELQLSSHAPLQAATRQRCPGCDKPRAFFCYDCLVPLMQGMRKFTALPVDVHIVMHGESNAQATGTHAAVLAPECVTFWRHNDGTSHHRRQPASKLQLPVWDPETTAVLYPESPDTPVVGLWGRLEQHGTSNLQDRQQQQQRRQQVQQKQGICAGTRQAAGQQQQPAAEQLLVELQQLAFSDARAATCIPGSCSCSSASSRSHQPVAAANCAAAATVHGGTVGSANSSSSCMDAATSSHSSSTTTMTSSSSSSLTSSSSSSLTTSSSSSLTSSSSSTHQSSPFPYKSVVILEGNWAKARTLLKHPKLAALPRLQLPPNVRSLFWRRGTGSFRAAVDSGVCTIEALYLLCRQLQPEPEECWDDLLWLWVYQRQLVQLRGSRQTRQQMQQNYEATCGAA